MTADEEIARHPFGQGLTREQLERIAACARTTELSTGEVVFREGGAADALYLLLGGHVVLEQYVPARGALQLESLTGGDILGLSWMFAGGRWVLDARAVEPTEAVVLDAACLRARMAEDPALGFVLAQHLLHQLYQRLERVRLQRLDVYRDERYACARRGP